MTNIIDLAAASALVMPCGKYRGLSLGEPCRRRMRQKWRERKAAVTALTVTTATNETQQKAAVNPPAAESVNLEGMP